MPTKIRMRSRSTSQISPGELVPLSSLKEGEWYSSLESNVIAVIVDGKPFYPFYFEGHYRSTMQVSEFGPEVKVYRVKSLIIQENCRS